MLPDLWVVFKWWKKSIWIVNLIIHCLRKCPYLAFSVSIPGHGRAGGQSQHALGRRHRCTLDRLPIHRTPFTHALILMGRLVFSLEPRTFLLWGDSAIQCTSAKPPLTIFIAEVKLRPLGGRCCYGSVLFHGRAWWSGVIFRQQPCWTMQNWL